MEEVNVVSDIRKFKPLVLQTKSDRKNKSSVEELLELEFKPLPYHLKYAYLRENDTLSLIISAQLNVTEEKTLLTMLKHHKKAVAWTLTDIQGIRHRIAWIRSNKKKAKRAQFNIKDD